MSTYAKRPDERLPDIGIGGAPDSGFRFDPVEHAYFLDGKPLHGITTVLGVIAKPALIQWAAKMACEYIEQTAEVQPAFDGGKVYIATEQILKDARIAHRRKKEDAADKGTDLHAEVEKFVQFVITVHGGVIPKGYTVPENIRQFNEWAQENNIKFLASEQRLYSKEHWVAGTCDLVFEKDGKTYIGDVKTYKKIWDRTPFFQCAAYGMMWEERGLERDEKGSLKVYPDLAGYCVLRLSKDGTFEAQWSFDIEGDRAAFLNALGLYKALKAFKA